MGSIEITDVRPLLCFITFCYDDNSEISYFSSLEYEIKNNVSAASCYCWFFHLSEALMKMLDDLLSCSFSTTFDKGQNKGKR